MFVGLILGAAALAVVLELRWKGAGVHIGAFLIFDTVFAGVLPCM